VAIAIVIAIGVGIGIGVGVGVGVAVAHVEAVAPVATWRATITALVALRRSVLMASRLAPPSAHIAVAPVR
jgi:hypothetical protein